MRGGLEYPISNPNSFSDNKSVTNKSDDFDIYFELGM